MFKKINLSLFFLVINLYVGFSQVVDISTEDFLPQAQEKFDGFIKRNSYDSAYRYLNTFDNNSLDYYLCWETLAHSYWEKGDLINSSSIAFWLRGEASLLKNPNELYPRIFHLIGNIYISENKLDSAIVNYQKAIYYRVTFIHPNDTSLVASYQNLSQIYSFRSDSANAFFYLEKAKDIVYLKNDNILQIASINARYADSYSRLAYYNLADFYYKEALAMLDENNIDHQLELAQIYTQKGRLSYYIGKFTESIELYTNALKFLEQLDETDKEQANVLELLADVYYMLKDYDSALQMYLKSYSILQALLPENHRKIIALHTDLAATYKGLEDYRNALIQFRLATTYSKLSPYQYRVFGETFWKADSLDKAEQLLKFANTISESRKIKDKKELADTHFWLGSFYLQTERNKLLGLNYLNRAIEGYRSVLGKKNELLGRAQLALAMYYLGENDTKKALEIIQSSIISLTPGFYTTDPLVNPDGLQMSLQSVANSLGWKAFALNKHFENTKDLNYLKASFDTYQLSLKMVEGFRLSQKYNSNLILNKEVNILLNQAILVSNKLYTITQEPKYFEATFSFIEQNKSTALLASLQQDDSIRLSNVPTNLIEKENNLKQNLLSLREKLNPLTNNLETLDQKLIQAYNIQKQSLQRGLDSIQNIIAKDYPEYYRLFYGNNVITIQDVQKQLSKDKVLIDYAITDSLLLVYVISKAKADLHTKKIPADFNNSILKLLQLLRYVNTENSYEEYKSYIKLAFENYNLLLGDFAKEIAGKELLIVPDGILSYLPFDILLSDTIAKEQPDYRKLNYFIRSNVSSTLNSAAIYFSYSKKKKPNYGQIIAFAPKYSFFEHLDSTRNIGYVLMPLPHVKRELESISAFFNPQIYKGDKATKIKFMTVAPKASVLHLAMHAVLNDDEPLKSELVFSESNNKSSSGLFTVGELFGMELSADLAVLSACNSGNGKLNKGEGIMSLSTGFQYAGVPSVIMTHWDVNDKYSADLVAGFYTYLAQGLEKNIALHLTKIDMINSGSAMYSHPYYWAGFTLIGNESAIVSRKSGFAKALEYLIPILIIFAFFIRIKKNTDE